MGQEKKKLSRPQSAGTKPHYKHIMENSDGGGYGKTTPTIRPTRGPVISREDTGFGGESVLSTEVGCTYDNVRTVLSNRWYV